MLILSKLKQFIDKKTLKSVYHAILKPYLCYSSLVWAQNLNSKTFHFAKEILTDDIFLKLYC